MRLLLEEVIESGYRPLATLDGRSYRVGRDLTTDIPFSSGALSRQHGVFVPFNSGWVFKDLGSTNGSWHNGSRLSPNHFVPLKEGDFLQLADVIVKIKYEGQAGELKGPRLLVVQSGEPLKEIPFTDYNSVISIGGSDSHLIIGGYHGDNPIVNFECINGSVIATPNISGVRIILNGEEFVQGRPLTRGDVVIVGEYECLFVDTPLVRYQGESRPFPISPNPQPLIDLTAVPLQKTQDSKDLESKPQVFSPVHTVAIKPDPQRIWRFGEAPPDEEEDPWAGKTPQKGLGVNVESNSLFDFERMSDAERRLVYGIIFFLGATVLLFLIWLLFL